jgi:hypothetical protein
MSYGGSKRGGGCVPGNSWCLLLDGQLERLESLLNALLSFLDVCIARMGGSSNFFGILVDP